MTRRESRHKPIPDSAPAAARGRLAAFRVAAVVAAVLLVVGAVRVRTSHFPLERDEGEYAYAGQLILEGIPPYQLACNMKFPGTYAAYAVAMAAFGRTPAGIHLGLMVVTSLTSVLLYGLGRRLAGEAAGVVAATTCAFLSASPSIDGLAAHATHFAALFVTAGLCLLVLAREKGGGWTAAAAGAAFGVGVLMKQQAVVLGLWGWAVIAMPGLRRSNEPLSRRLETPALYAAGAILPAAITGAILWRTGVFESFWFWTITYARAYVSEIGIDAAPRMFLYGVAYVLGSNPLLWFLGAAGVFAIGLDRTFHPVRGILAGFLVASFLTTCPGFYFRTHYFLLMVPAVSLLAGCAVSAALRDAAIRFGRSRLRSWPAIGYAAILLLSAFGNRGAWFLLPPIQAERALYGINPFPEAEVVSEYIRAHSAPGDQVAVLGSEPEIYFLSHRRSATTQIYTYALMEAQPYAHRMHVDMIRDIESARPEYVVFVRVRTSWLARAGSDLTVNRWWEGKYRNNYDLVGLAEIRSLTETRYTWGDAAAEPASADVNGLLVYRRKRPSSGA